MQYKLNDKFAIKASINHAFINDIDIDAITDIKVGLRYSFKKKDQVLNLVFFILFFSF
tara:strand:- start:297 stop:470 length:174 start_codon:yes stop_codon:yes gene_type:complete